MSCKRAGDDDRFTVTTEIDNSPHNVIIVTEDTDVLTF